MDISIVQLLFYFLPALLTGIIAFYFFKLHTANEEGRRRYLLHKETHKSILPIRLQAYERITLFLERMAPQKLLLRVPPISDQTSAYENLLIATIEQEFDHNISQQIYMSDEGWNIVKAAKNATIQVIRKAAMNEKTTSADKLREAVLSEYIDKQTPSANALGHIKKEIQELWD